MKADRFGTGTEQVRASVGWQGARAATAAGIPANERCQDCADIEWVAHAHSIRAHCTAARFATRAQATCAEWRHALTLTGHSNQHPENPTE